MTNMRSFFGFLAVIVLVTVAFGLYVYSLSSCTDSTLSAIECHKLYLAFGVLFTVAIMLALGAGFFALVPAKDDKDSPGRPIFDTFAKTLPPIATLVLGYYFGSAQTTAQAVKGATPKANAVSASAPEAAASAK